MLEIERERVCSFRAKYKVQIYSDSVTSQIPCVVSALVAIPRNPREFCFLERLQARPRTGVVAFDGDILKQIY